MSPFAQTLERKLLLWRAQSGLYLVAHPFLDIVVQGATSEQARQTFLECFAMRCLYMVDEKGRIDVPLAPPEVAERWRFESENYRRCRSTLEALERLPLESDPVLAELDALEDGEAPAPEGQVYVCSACGKTNSTRYPLDESSAWDESCMLHAVLCYTEKTADGSWRAVQKEEA